jgi:hypothetical protein
VGNDQRHGRSMGVEIVGIGRDSKIPVSRGEKLRMRSRDRATFRVTNAYYDVICYVWLSVLTLCLKINQLTGMKSASTPN